MCPGGRLGLAAAAGDGAGASEVQGGEGPDSGSPGEEAGGWWSVQVGVCGWKNPALAPRGGVVSHRSLTQLGGRFPQLGFSKAVVLDRSCYSSYPKPGQITPRK